MVDASAPFARITFDLSSAEAVQLEQLWLKSGKNKKQFYRDVFVSYIESNNAPKRRKGKQS